MSRDVRQLKLPQIRTDGGTQARASLDQAAIDEYADLLRTDAAEFPPVVVFLDKAGVYWLAGGFHRLEAHKRAGRKTILAEVRQGSLRDAILWAIGDNATHGIRRKREDKRRAVEMLLRDEEWSKWNDSEIARRASVSRTFAAMVRRELSCINAGYGRPAMTPAPAKAKPVSQMTDAEYVAAVREEVQKDDSCKACRGTGNLLCSGCGRGCRCVCPVCNGTCVRRM